MTKPTLKTISQLSGMAVPTVSRALAGAPDISAATKEKVRRIAQELGYVPNRAGVRLRTGKTSVISIVMSTEHEMMNMTARLISSVALGLRDTSYHLNVTPYLPKDDPMTAIQYIVESRSADAVIFNQVEPDDPRVDYLLANKFPFATHGRSNRASEYAYFDFDNFEFAKIGVHRLVEKGRSKLIMIAPPRTQNYANNMVEGAKTATDSTAVSLQIISSVTSDSSIAEIRTAVKDALHEDPAIDGLLIGSPMSTMAAVGGIEAAGKVLGDDFDIATKEAISFLNLFREPIIVIEEDVAAAGEFLARAAVHATSHPDESPLQFLDVPN